MHFQRLERPLFIPLEDDGPPQFGHKSIVEFAVRRRAVRSRLWGADRVLTTARSNTNACTAHRELSLNQNMGTRNVQDLLSTVPLKSLMLVADPAIAFPSSSPR